MKPHPHIVALLLILFGLEALCAAQGTEQAEAKAEGGFFLSLPVWNPDPEDLPPELRPLDVVRPVLPEEVAAEVAELEILVTEIEGSWLEAESRASQDTALDEAIKLAERVLAFRLEHQGNTADAVRWRDVAGVPSEWYEVIAARQKVAHLHLMRRLSEEDRAAVASLKEADSDVNRLYAEGRYTEAQAVTERQFAIRRRILCDEHLETLISMGNMGFLLQAQRRLEEAEPYFRETLESHRRVLGNDHPDTLGSIHNMGLLLRSQGRLAEVEPYMREMLESLRRVLGDEHPNTIHTINNMGMLLRQQGRLAEAEPYYLVAMDAYRRVLGDEHPDTLNSINSMGDLLEAQGRLAEAERYSFVAMNGLRRVLGDEDPITLGAINNMGILLTSQGRLFEAEPYYLEALEARRRVLGDEHPQTLNSINNMGVLHWKQGRLSQVEPYLREAMETQRRVLGDGHPDTLGSINNMGFLLQGQGRLAEAKLYFLDALHGFRRMLGDKHPDTINSVNNLGVLLWQQGRLEEAETLYLEALEGFRLALGDEHSDTLNSINNIGVLLKAQGRLAEAEPYSWEAMEGLQRLLGDEHPLTLASINNMGDLLKVQGRVSEAEPYYRKAMEGFRRVFGDEHPDTLKSTFNIASLLQSQDRIAQADLYYRKALSTAERLRVDIAGDASERAQFAGKLDLVGIALAYSGNLIGMGHDGEALSVLERGRGRAGLDMFAGGRSAADRALRAAADPDRLARYDAALAAEQEAQLAVAESEARLAAAPDADKSARREEMLAARRTLSEKTAAVFAELRGLVPAVDPMTSEQMLAALRPGEAVLTWAWTSDGVIALVARDGRVTGLTLAKDKAETEALNASLAALRTRIASRPVAGDAGMNAELAAARRAVVPDELFAMLSGVSSVIAVADGPLMGVPIELLLPEVPVSYAPSATIALRPRLERSASTASVASSAGVVVGDPVFAGMDRDEPDYPQAGILLVMVADDSNAAVAGLTRGDVLLSYGEHELAGPNDLGPAIGATAEALATRDESDTDRPIAARVWRDGQEIEVALAPGRMGVQMDQRPPADGLRSMATFDRSADELAANANALEQIRFYGGGLSRLPATRLEAEAVAALLGDEATLLLGDNATAPKLREAVESSPPRVLHLATHGLLGSADRPLLASLALTTPDEPTGEDTGFVTLGDILSTWGGQLRATELVVLSACDTATAVRQGDTMMALPLGLLVSGAESVLASLWKVDDRATALLMARFYANWLGKTESEREIDGVAYAPGEALPKLAALREAQAWLRDLTAEQVRTLTGATAGRIAAETSRGPSPRRGRLSAGQDPDNRPYEHPYYWAAFTMHGQSE